MEKKIYCHFAERCKIIKFASIPGISDLDIITDKIKEICKRDILLNNLMQNKLLVIQKKDNDRDIWCDIDENDDEVVEDKDDLKILFLNLESTTLVQNSLETVPVEILENPLILSKQNSNLVLEVNNEEASDVDKIINEPVVIESFSKPINKAKDEKNSTCNNEILDTATESATSNYMSSSELINSEIKLPDLTKDLGKKLEETSTNALPKIQHKLVAHWASYLYKKTIGHPSKNDYKTFGNLIIKKYPQIADNNNGEGSALIRHQISTWIRNYRYTLNHEKEKFEGKPPKKSRRVEIIPKAPSSSSLSTNESMINIDRALTELQKGDKNVKNYPHIKKLLKITQQERVKWIKSDEVKNVKDIVSQYPQLLDPDLILYEFCNLKGLGSESHLFKNIKIMINELSIHFGIKDDSARSQVVAIEKLCNTLRNKKLKGYSPLFTVKETRSSLKDLNSTAGDSVRAVIYTEKDDLAVAWLVADEDIKIKIPEPSMMKTIACLLGAHYVWDTQFPAAYKNVLTFFDYKILEVSIPTNCMSVHKLVKEIKLKVDSTIKSEDDD